jgi:hypothetical protein
VPRAFLIPLSLVLAVVSAPARAVAQEVDLAGGYSLLTYGSGCLADCTIPAGWFGTLGVKLTPTLDVVADVSGAYKSVGSTASFSEHAYLFGPRLQWSRSTMPLRVYGQLTLGGVTGKIAAGSVSDSTTLFAVAPGLGVDVRMDDRWAVRGGVNFRFVKPSGSGNWFQEAQVIAGLAYTIK